MNATRVIELLEQNNVMMSERIVELEIALSKALVTINELKKDIYYNQERSSHL